METRLSAYIDGETSHEEKLEIDRLLASDAEARRMLDILRHGSDVGRKAFDDVLKEPVPLALVRSIKSVEPPKRRAPRFIRKPLKIAPNGKQALAAAILFFAVGCGIGYLLGTTPNGTANAVALPQTQVSSRAWLDDLAATHRLYAHQTDHLVEVAAGQAKEISHWLTENVGVRFTTPDLTRDGLTFQGARMTVAGGRPAGQLFYQNNDGEVIIVGFMKSNITAQDSEIEETIKDDVAVVSWTRNGITYSVVGASSDPMLDDIAYRVSANI